MRPLRARTRLCQGRLYRSRGKDGWARAVFDEASRDFEELGCLWWRQVVAEERSHLQG